MNIKEYVRKIRDYEIKIRKSIDTQIQGDFFSVYKGSGVLFDDIRLYQYGDDVKHIHWNATAKGQGTFIKNFREEREQKVIFLIDISASQEIGEKNKKIDIAKELCGVLSISALKQGSSVGILAYSDRCELYRKAKKQLKELFQCLGELYYLQPQSTKTDLAKAIHHLLDVCHTKHLVIVISDFIDEGYEKNLKTLIQKHDVIIFQVFDKREKNMLPLGIVPVYELEHKKKIWINTSSSLFKNKYLEKIKNKKKELKLICKKNNANYLQIMTTDNYVPKLVELFKKRHTMKKN